jgi:hypothetical protein
MEDKLKALRDVLKNAESVTVPSGAGISAECGAPTPYSNFMVLTLLGKVWKVVPPLVEDLH